MNVPSLLKFAIPLIALCSACSSINVPELDLTAPTTSIEIYIRGSGTTSAIKNNRDFEQYKLTPAEMYAECGTTRSGEHILNQHGVLKLSEDPKLAIHEALRDIFKERESDQEGVQEKNGESVQIKVLASYPTATRLTYSAVPTNIVDDSEDGAESIKELVELVRGVSKRAPCGNDFFAGFSRVRPSAE